MFSQKDIDQIVYIGKCNDEDCIDSRIKALDFKDDFHKYFYSLSKIYNEYRYNKIDIIYLYKGLIILERELKAKGGSVSPCIPLYKFIVKENLDPDYAIADWAFVNTNNPYVPFGTWNYGMQTTRAYLEFQRDKEYKSANRAQHYRKVLERVEGRKLKRKNAIAALRKLNSEERGKIKEELIKKYENFSMLQKLEIIIADAVYPPEYYPVEWVRLTEVEIQTLPINVLKQLYDRLSCMTKGEWKRFALKLSKYDDGI